MRLAPISGLERCYQRSTAIGSGAGVFVVAYSSNPGGRRLQDARHPDGRTVAEALADDVTSFNATQGPGIGMLGAVLVQRLIQQRQPS